MGSLLATMPLSATAAYGAKQLLHFSHVQLAGTGGAMTAIAVDAVQVAAYFGDVWGWEVRLSLNDATAILRVASGSGQSFADDPSRLRGLSESRSVDHRRRGSSGKLNGADAGAMGQESNGLLKITIPFVPIGLSVASWGPTRP